jgi:hypothetical protein
MAQVWQSSVISFMKEVVIVPRPWIRHTRLSHGCLFCLQYAPVFICCGNCPAISHFVIAYLFYAQEHCTFHILGAFCNILGIIDITCQMFCCLWTVLVSPSWCVYKKIYVNFRFSYFICSVWNFSTWAQAPTAWHVILCLIPKIPNLQEFMMCMSDPYTAWHTLMSCSCIMHGF